MAVLMAADVLVQFHRGAQRVPNGAYRLVRQGQLLPFPRKLPLDLGGLFRQLPHKVSPVVDHQAPARAMASLKSSSTSSRLGFFSQSRRILVLCSKSL